MLARAHRRFRRAVDQFVDGELHDGAHVRAVRRHLDDCPDCSQYARFLHTLKASLRRMGDRQPPSLTVTRLERWADERLR